MERISALMDGELDDVEAAGQLKQLVTSEVLQAAWHEYHLIGDVIRRESVATVGFTARLHGALDREPTVLAPRALPAVSKKARLYAMSAAASVAGVAAVVWLAYVNNPGVLTGGGQLVAVVAPPSATVNVEPRAVSETARPEVADYLMAHQEYSPSNTMRGVASYIRTVGLQENDMSR